MIPTTVQGKPEEDPSEVGDLLFATKSVPSTHGMEVDPGPDIFGGFQISSSSGLFFRIYNKPIL